MRYLFFILALASMMSVASADDPPELETNMAFSLGETRFLVEDVPVRMTREEAVNYVTDDLSKQFDELKKHFLEGVEKSLTSGDTKAANVRRCHVKYDINGNIMWCEGNPYDCLCVYVFAPPA